MATKPLTKKEKTAMAFFSMGSVFGSTLVVLTLLLIGHVANAAGFEQPDWSTTVTADSGQVVDGADQTGIYGDHTEVITDVTFTLTNTGTGTCAASASTANAYTGGHNLSDARSVSIAPGETQDVTYTWTASSVVLHDVVSYVPYPPTGTVGVAFIGGTGCVLKYLAAAGSVLGTDPDTAIELQHPKDYRIAVNTGGFTSGEGGSTPTSDTRAAPAAFFYDPPPDRIFGPLILDAYTFRVAVDIDSTDWPDESIIFDYQILDSPGGSVLYDNPALPFLLDNTVICGQPGDCTRAYYAATFTVPYHFGPGDFYLRVRAKTVQYATYGAWSDELHVTVQAEQNVPSCSVFAIGGPPDGMACLWEWLQYLIFPTPGSVEYLQESLTADTPFEGVIAVTDGDDPWCPLPTFEMDPDTFGAAGSPLEFDLCDAAEDSTAQFRTGTLQDVTAGIVSIALLGIGVLLFKRVIEG